MTSKLYEVTNCDAGMYHSHKILQVLADTRQQAKDLARDFLVDFWNSVQGPHAFIMVRTLESDLEDVTWKVLIDGELYHPGTMNIVLSEYNNASRYDEEGAEHA